jgi:hypothetical protein
MEKKMKKTYEKPKVTKINLDAKTAVLGFCKGTGQIGPGISGCEPVGPCSTLGS